MSTDNSNLIHVYLDDQEEPIVSYRPPVRFELDTTQLEDGPHVIKVVATDSSGKEGVKTIPFEVRNGPGIDVDGLQENDVLEGRVPILLNAYGGAKEPYWQPSRAETPAPVPTWAWVLLLVIVAWSTFYITQQWTAPDEYAESPTYSMFYGDQSSSSSSPDSATEKANLGATLYRTSCSSCHQGNGEGVTGAFPPLAGDPVVTDEDPTRHIEIILFGMEGEPIEGVEYSAAMPPFSEQLSDEEVAAIINHERTSWGNDAPTVTAEEVGEVRAEGN
ncbi:Cytochrome C oxidase, cbb3-type, subunit III [Fodinibius roseus]|uniref:Cytochrome C oxidase, cbb3-type, subunit III n=1 Tax=Fodinibius roseus TaxID=1194090 RepID=A0A1M5KA58_9BACT|nr:cytochrome c [Fodinibius roseus]SHG49073.1 Cytochrome C oxidase, cbb3-type, subunit III [Fodinibius roseus]